MFAKWISFSLLGAAVIAATGLSAASGGGCVSAEVDRPVQLPDGSVHAAGRLTICDSRPFTPVSTIHRTYVDGMPVAMLLSERERTEGHESIEPEMLFHADADAGGSLQLVGYALPARGRNVSFRFTRPAVPRGTRGRGLSIAASFTSARSFVAPAD